MCAAEHDARMWNTVLNAPYARALELAVIDDEGEHPLVFPCQRTRTGWKRALTGVRVDVSTDALAVLAAGWKWPNQRAGFLTPHCAPRKDVPKRNIVDWHLGAPGESPLSNRRMPICRYSRLCSSTQQSYLML
jgi:hypothetical protein